MMTADYYIQERSSEKHAVERWENEGGRLPQDRHHSYDSSKDYQRQMKQKFPMGGLYRTNDIDSAIMPVLAEDLRVGQVKVQSLLYVA